MLYDKTTQCCMTGLHSVVYEDYTVLYDRTMQCCMTGLPVHSVVCDDYTVFLFNVGLKRLPWIKLLSFRPSFIRTCKIIFQSPQTSYV